MIIVPGPPALADYTDTFDRPDSTDLGPAWRPEHLSCQVISNKAQCRELPRGTARTGAWETYVGDYGGRLLTDNWEVTAPLATVTGSASVADFTAIGVGMQEDGPAPGMLLVYLATCRTTGPAGGSRIMTWEGSAITAPATCTDMAGQTVRASNTTAIFSTDTITLRRRMYSPTQSIITALINGATALTWDDTAGVVAAGNPYRRRWFIVCEADTPSFLSTRFSPALASVRARDLTT